MTIAVYFALKSMPADAILLSKYKKNRPENAFREVVSTREIYGKKWRIFRAQNFSGALRNTRKSFRELYGTVSGPEKFSGLLRNARQGREFVNRINEELFKLCGTDHRISSAYHPQSNGLDERMNQTLTRAIVKFVNDNHDDWDVHLNPFCSPIEQVRMTPPNSPRSSWCLAVHPCYPSRWKSGKVSKGLFL